MSDETLFAILEERGYRRDQIAKLDRWYVARVLCHPKDRHGNVEVRRVQGMAPPADVAVSLRRLYRRQNWPEWRVEKQVGLMMEGRARAYSASGTEPPAGG